MLVQQSATISTCGLGKISPGTVHFKSIVGIGLAENCVVGLKMYVLFPSQALCHYHEPILTLQYMCSTLQPYIHVIWANSAPELLIFCQNWGLTWQKWCFRIKIPCMIRILGFINLAYELILTFHCSCTSLQPYAHVTWAKSVLELFLLESKLGTDMAEMVF